MMMMMMCTEDTTMFELRSFIRQRLSAAAEEILEEVEKTLTCKTLVLQDVHRPHNQRQKRDSLHWISALNQSTTQPSIQEESTLSTAEALGPSETSADTDNNDGNDCSRQTNSKMSKIKEEEQEIEIAGQTWEVVKSEPETQVSYELQPVSSDGSASQSENNGSEGEWVQSKGARRKLRRRKVKKAEAGPAPLPDGDSSAKTKKEHRACPVCGKGFQYIFPFIKHLKTHKRTSKATKTLLRHLQNAHKKRLFCDVCGKKFTNPGCLQIHSKIHAGVKAFKCQDCGKSFVQKQQLVVHARIHSGERPYHCDICGKSFIQRQNLTVHSRIHTGERPYHCGTCGKQFYSCGNLKKHTERFSGQTPSSCDICGKTFCHRGHLIRHQKAHTAGSAE